MSRALEHRGARRRQVALDPQHGPLPAGEPLLATVATPRASDHLRERDAKHVAARGIQRRAEPLIVGGGQYVGVSAADLLQGAGIRLVAMHIEHVGAEQRERIQQSELVPVLLEANRGALLSFPPQQTDHLLVRPRRAAPERPYALEYGGHRAPETLPVRHIVAHALAQRQLGVVQLELAGLEVRAGLNTV